MMRMRMRIRLTYPITGGSFEGERMRGTVLPSGDDWTIKRSDGILELDMRVTLATNNSARSTPF